MSPIVTTIGNSGARGRVGIPVIAPPSGDWDFPNIGGGFIGPGPNAPSWSGKTTYTEESFASPIPVSPSAANAAGFRGFNGFGTPPFGDPRIQYVSESTPIGTKDCMRMYYRGQTETLTAAGQTTTAWPYRTDFNAFYRACVFIQGTWSGTLEFENSTDGGTTWNSVSLTARPISGSSHVTGTSTTINGLWETTATQTSNALVRVRVASLASGSVSARVGQIGGYASANFTGGTFDANQGRIYVRLLYRSSANWTDGGNTGTKGVFYSQTAGGNNNNHYVGFLPSPTVDPNVYNFGYGLQGHITTPFVEDPTPRTINIGEWCDLEMIFEANTVGSDNGIVKMWANGVEVLNRSNVRHFASNSTFPYFNALWFDPTYGGGQRPPPYEIFLDYSNVYRESAP